MQLFFTKTYKKSHLAVLQKKIKISFKEFVDLGFVKICEKLVIM